MHRSLDDVEDYYLAESAQAKIGCQAEPMFDLDEVRKELGLDWQFLYPSPSIIMLRGEHKKTDMGLKGRDVCETGYLISSKILINWWISWNEATLDQSCSWPYP